MDQNCESLRKEAIEILSSKLVDLHMKGGFAVESFIISRNRRTQRYRLSGVGRAQGV